MQEYEYYTKDKGSKFEDTAILIGSIPCLIWFFTYPIVLVWMLNSDVSYHWLWIWAAPAIPLLGIPILGPFVFAYLLYELWNGTF